MGVTTTGFFTTEVKKMSTTEKPQFHEHHERYLKARSVPPEYAHAAGVSSLGTASRVVVESMKKSFPGLFVPPVGSLMVPYEVGALDKINRARLRPDEDFYWKGEHGQEEKLDLPRWIAQKNVPVVPYFPPQVFVESITGDATVPLHIVEAPIKALALSANGFPAIGLGGVEAGFHDREEWKKSKHLAIHQELARIQWKGRTAYVVYDAGVQNNPAVSLGAAKLSIVLRDAGAHVKLVPLPLLHVQEMSVDECVVYGVKDQGPDDFLGRHGSNGQEKLRELIDRAVPADPVERAKLVQAMDVGKAAQQEEAAKLLDDLTFVAGLHVGGGVVVDRVTAAFDKLGIKKKSVQEKIHRLRDRLGDARGGDAQEVELPYAIDSNRIAMKVMRDADEQLRYLADFTANIVEEIVTDDGTDTTRTYRLTGMLPDGKALPVLDVAAAEYASMDWIARWGSRAILRAGRDTRDHARVAIQALSKPEEKTVYAHLGWREIDGKMVYLHPGGAIGGDGVPVQVNIGTERGKFWLPDEVRDLPDAIRHSLSILDCGPLDITLPVLAAPYTAVLSSVLEPDFAVYVVGLTGTFKSTITSKAQAHFGHYDYNSLPASWYSTANYIETVLFRYKDALAVVDNYVPGQTARDHQELQQKALRIIQCIGDRSSRGRLDRNSEERARRDPRGLTVMTGEDLPPANESTIGRLVVVDVPKSALILDRLRAVQDKAGLLPHAMRGFIEHLARDYGGAADRIKEIKIATAASFRAQLAGCGLHERIPNSLATLATGFLAFIDYAHAAGAIDMNTFDTLHMNVDSTFMNIVKRQRINVEGARPTDKYLSALKALLVQGRVALAPIEEALDKHSSGTTRAIGWVGEDEVLLVGDLAWDAVESFLGKDRWPTARPSSTSSSPRWASSSVMGTRRMAKTGSRFVVHAEARPGACSRCPNSTSRKPFATRPPTRPA